MSEKPSDGGLHIDSDWKTEAAQEKERLAAEEEKRQRPSGTESGGTAASFLELVNLVAMQAAIGLGGFQGPGGERIPPNPSAAKYHIDLLEILEDKTEGNLSEEEKRTLGAVLHELRMQYVETVTAPPPPAGKETGKA